MRKSVAALLCILTLSLYGARAYIVNHSYVIDFLPKNSVCEFGERVEMADGYYNNGRMDLSGYYIEIIDTQIVQMESFLAVHEMTKEFLDMVGLSQSNQYLCIVTAVFDYKGTSNPIEKIIDLTSLMLVGPDYYLDYSYEVNWLEGFNPMLQGNSQFTIRNNASIEIELPFPIDTQSLNAVPINYFIKSEPKLLISTYPEEIYLELGEIYLNGVT